MDKNKQSENFYTPYALGVIVFGPSAIEFIQLENAFPGIATLGREQRGMMGVVVWIFARKSLPEMSTGCNM